MVNPIVIWTGKKSGGLLDLILNTLPPTINNYYEPFCGSANVFLHLEQQKIINGDYYISDLNDRIIRIYREVKNNLSIIDRTQQQFINLANSGMSLYDIYYSLRVIEDAPWKKPYNHIPFAFNCDAELVAKDLFLDHMCKNGWREAGNGMNVAYYDDRTNPTYFYKPTDLQYFSKVLNNSNVHIDYCCYLKVLKNIKTEDFVYLDPPYRKTDKNKAYSYTANGSFPDREQYRLARVLDYIDNKGAKFMLSNAICAKDLYSKYRVEETNAKGYLSGSKRTEILVYNY